jgi:hypothetical protein
MHPEPAASELAMHVTRDTFNPSSFVLLPSQLLAIPAPDWEHIRELYREAFEKARAVRQPSVIDRLWAVTSN